MTIDLATINLGTDRPLATINLGTIDLGGEGSGAWHYPDFNDDFNNDFLTEGR